MILVRVQYYCYPNILLVMGSLGLAPATVVTGLVSTESLPPTLLVLLDRLGDLVKESPGLSAIRSNGK